MRGVRDNSDLGFLFTLSASTTELGNVQGNVTRFWKGSVALETRSIPTSLRNCLPYPTVSVLMIPYYCSLSVTEYIVYVVSPFRSTSWFSLFEEFYNK